MSPTGGIIPVRFSLFKEFPEEWKMEPKNFLISLTRLALTPSFIEYSCNHRPSPQEAPTIKEMSQTLP